MNKALVIAEIALVTIIQVIITNKDSVAALYITIQCYTHTHTTSLVVVVV